MRKQDMYYKKDKKAQIYKKAGSRVDEYGDVVPGGYRPIRPNELWCYTSQLSQNDIYYAAHYGEKEERLFVFNYLKEVALYDMLRYKGTWYRITRVDHKQDYNSETYIYVTLAIGGWKPGDDEILPYVDPNESTDSDEVLYDEDGFPITRG